MTCATVASVGRPASISRAGAGAWTTILAGGTGVFRAPNDENLELGRRDVDLLADVLANLVRYAAAARADLALDIDVSMRGTCVRSVPRLARRLRALSVRTSGDVASASAAVCASACSTSSRTSSS